MPAIDLTVPWSLTVSDFNTWEGRVPHLYLDTRGFVTVGVGQMLPNVAAALALPFVRRGDRVLAPPEEIRADFERVKQQPMGQLAGSYRRFTQLDLPDPAIDVLLQATAHRFELALGQNFRGYDHYPVPAKRALLDMVFNLGLDGLLKFRKLKAAAEAGQWAAAAAECRRNGPSEDRNAWTRQMLLDAAG